MTMRITKHGETVLQQETPLVEYGAIASELPELLRNMWKTMYAAKGVGLAAPQVGLTIRLAVIDVKPAGKSERLVLINPEIIGREGTVYEEEGCLSVPGLYAKVRRHKKVGVRALDAGGKEYEREGTGLLARAFEHEIDHLHGKLFLHHLSLPERLRVAGMLKDLKKGWD